jgi:hypothetical protein
VTSPARIQPVAPFGRLGRSARQEESRARPRPAGSRSVRRPGWRTRSERSGRGLQHPTGPVSSPTAGRAAAPSEQPAAPSAEVCAPPETPRPHPRSRFRRRRRFPPTAISTSGLETGLSVGWIGTSWLLLARYADRPTARWSDSAPGRSDHRRSADVGPLLQLIGTSYLNQMRWYPRLSGCSSRATSAASKMRFKMSGKFRTSVPPTAMRPPTWSTAAATATP